MTRPKHRPPSRLTIRNVAIADGAVLAMGLTFALATAAAPHTTRSAAAAQPTVEVREPTGHGGLGGPVAGPSFAPDVPVWSPEKGPVVVDGMPLETPQPSAEPVRVAPTYESPAPIYRPAPAPVAAAAEPEQSATGLLALVNADRAAAGCGPVTIADDLTSQAQTQSNAQAAADSMFHSSAGPDGYDTWGENVAFGQATEAEVHQWWLASPGHRDNVLNCSYALIGWASADSATGVRYWTEMFGA